MAGVTVQLGRASYAGWLTVLAGVAQPRPARALARELDLARARRRGARACCTPRVSGRRLHGSDQARENRRLR